VFDVFCTLEFGSWQKEMRNLASQCANHICTHQAACPLLAADPRPSAGLCTGQNQIPFSTMDAAGWRSTPLIFFSVLALVLFIHLIGFSIYIFCLFMTFVAGTI